MAAGTRTSGGGEGNGESGRGEERSAPQRAVEEEREQAREREVHDLVELRARAGTRSAALRRTRASTCSRRSRRSRGTPAHHRHAGTTAGGRSDMPEHYTGPRCAQTSWRQESSSKAARSCSRVARRARTSRGSGNSRAERPSQARTRARAAPRARGRARHHDAHRGDPRRRHFIATTRRTRPCCSSSSKRSARRPRPSLAPSTSPRSHGAAVRASMPSTFPPADIAVLAKVQARLASFASSDRPSSR